MSEPPGARPPDSGVLPSPPDDRLVTPVPVTSGPPVQAPSSLLVLEDMQHDLLQAVSRSVALWRLYQAGPLAASSVLAVRWNWAKLTEDSRAEVGLTVNERWTIESESHEEAGREIAARVHRGTRMVLMRWRSAGSPTGSDLTFLRHAVKHSVSAPAFDGVAFSQLERTLLGLE